MKQTPATILAAIKKIKVNKDFGSAIDGKSKELQGHGDPSLTTVPSPDLATKTNPTVELPPKKEFKL